MTRASISTATYRASPSRRLVAAGGRGATSSARLMSAPARSAHPALGDVVHRGHRGRPRRPLPQVSPLPDGRRHRRQPVRAHARSRAQPARGSSAGRADRRPSAGACSLRHRGPARPVLAWYQQLGTARRAIRYGFRTAQRGVTMVQHVRSSDAPTTMVGEPVPALNDAIGPRRQVTYASVSLDDVRKLGKKLDVKVNDVVLALCAGSLRDYLVDRDQLPESSPGVRQRAGGVDPSGRWDGRGQPGRDHERRPGHRCR